MSTLETAARDAARNAINALLDDGAGTYPTLRFRTAADADLLVVNLDQTKAIADAATGVSNVNPPDGELDWVGYEQLPTAAGVPAKAVYCNRAGVAVETSSVGDNDSGEEFRFNVINWTTALPVRFNVVPTVTQRATYDPTP